jgi:hypothetical protein
MHGFLLGLDPVKPDVDDLGAQCLFDGALEWL